MFANNEFSPFIFLEIYEITFTSIIIDRVFLLLKVHLLGMTREALFCRNVASFYYSGKINFLNTITGFTILIKWTFCLWSNYHSYIVTAATEQSFDSGTPWRVRVHCRWTRTRSGRIERSRRKTVSDTRGRVAWYKLSRDIT